MTHTEHHPRELGKTAHHMRYVRVRRLPRAERKSLGLEPGVGYTEPELTRFRYYRALEHILLKEARAAELTPLQSIGFDGRPPSVKFVSRSDLPADIRGLRNTSSTPLDYLYFQAKAPIAFWEWVAGKRFEYDVQRSRRDVPITADLTRLMTAKIEKMTAAEKRRRAMMTFKPRTSAKRGKATFEVADSRLDAMARLGRLQDEISKISYYLLDQVIGQEQTLSRVAGRIGVDQRYVSQRFREALWEAAAHYKMLAGGEAAPACVAMRCRPCNCAADCTPSWATERNTPEKRVSAPSIARCAIRRNQILDPQQKRASTYMRTQSPI